MLTPGPLTATFWCSTCLRTFRNPVPPLLKRWPQLKALSLSLACGLCPPAGSLPSCPSDWWRQPRRRGLPLALALSERRQSRAESNPPPLSLPLWEPARRGRSRALLFTSSQLLGPLLPRRRRLTPTNSGGPKGGRAASSGTPKRCPSFPIHTHTHGRRQPPTAFRADP